MPVLHVAPLGRRLEVKVGTSILRAANAGGVELQQVCGGQCSCTTCKVQVLAGAEFLSPVSRAEQERLTPWRVSQGYRLACQAEVTAGEVTVAIPALMPRHQLP